MNSRQDELFYEGGGDFAEALKKERKKTERKKERKKRPKERKRRDGIS